VRHLKSKVSSLSRTKLLLPLQPLEDIQGYSQTELLPWILPGNIYPSRNLQIRFPGSRECNGSVQKTNINILKND